MLTTTAAGAKATPTAGVADTPRARKPNLNLKQRPPRALFCLKLDNSCCYARNVIVKLVQECKFLTHFTSVVRKQTYPPVPPPAPTPMVVCCSAVVLSGVTGECVGEHFARRVECRRPAVSTRLDDGVRPAQRSESDHTACTIHGHVTHSHLVRSVSDL